MSWPSPVERVTVTILGVTYEGTYYVQQSIVYVQSAYGSKATQVGGFSSPEALAKMLLSELQHRLKIRNSGQVKGGAICTPFWRSSAEKRASPIPSMARIGCFALAREKPCWARARRWFARRGSILCE